MFILLLITLKIKSMVNKNVFDAVMMAIEEYNEYTRKKDVSKLTDNEKRGLFYTCLRRWVKFNTGRRPELQVNDFICKFSPSGILESYFIPRNYSKGTHDWEQWNPISDTIREVKNIGVVLPKLYPTKVLNEMALIVNNIKP